MSKLKISEADLASKFIEHFEGFDIYPEVNVPGGICDIVLKLGKVHVSIEVKTSFNLCVIHQALKNIPYFNMSYVAVPRPTKTRNWEAEKICETLGIGVLYYDNVVSESPHSTHDGTRWIRSYKKNSSVKEVVKPKYTRVKYVPKLYEWQKRSISGSVSDRLTHFKITVENITDMIRKSGGRVLISDIFKDNKYHYASIKGARIGILQMIDRGVIKEFKSDSGYLILNNENS